MNIINFFFLLGIILYTQNIEAKDCKPLLWNIDRLDYIKKNKDQIPEVRNLLLNAEKLIHDEDISVTQKTNSLSNNKHNYESLSSYFWPNPDNIHGAYIEKDGLLNPETQTDDRNRLNKVSERIMKFALAYYITEDIKYSNACIQQIKVWFLNKETYMYPNFQYAQIIKNKNNNKGQPHGIIDAYVMNDIIESLRLLDYTNKVEGKTKERMQTWFENFAIWLTTDDLGIKESKQNNNHAIAYDVLLLNISLFTKNQERADSIITLFKEKRLNTLIKKDGSQPGEQHRTKSYYYSYYNLIHIVDFCKILDSINIDYYFNNRNLIDKPFNYLISFFDNQDLYPYTEIRNWSKIVKGIKMECERLNELAIKKNIIKTFPEYNSNFYDNIHSWIK